MGNIEEISSKISAIDGKISDNAQTVSKMQADVESLKSQTAVLNDMQNSMKSMQSELNALQQLGAAASKTEVVKGDYGSRFVASEKFKAFRDVMKSDRNASIRLELAAAPETTQASNSASRTSLAMPYDAGIVTDPRAVLNIESLFGKINISANAYQYVKYGNIA